VLTFFTVLFALGFAPEAHAVPKRPTTFVADPRLSEGPTENFTNLAVNPFKLAAILQPVVTVASAGPTPPAVAQAGSQPTGTTLLIANDRSYTAQVAVNGTLVGDIGPYTDGAIYGLKMGKYDVRLSHTTGYSYTTRVPTTVVERPIVPGGAGALVVLPNKGNPAKSKAE
jgi:hypothetical protein